MALKWKVTPEELSTLDERIRSEYVENGDGSYRVDLGDDDPALPIKNTLHSVREELHNLKAERDKLAGELSSVKERLDATSSIDPDRYAELSKLAENGPLDRERLLKEARDEVTRQWEGKYNETVQSLEGQIESQKTLVENTMLDTTAMQAIVENDGIPELLMPIVRNRLRLREKSGKLVPVVIGEDGAELLSRDPNNDGLMSAAEYVGLLGLEDKFAGAFRTRIGSGGGSPVGDASGAGGPRLADKPSSQMTEKEKMECITDIGPAAWADKLAKEAEDHGIRNIPLFTSNTGR